MDTNENCPKCSGVGDDRGHGSYGEWLVCDKCDGTGRVYPRASGGIAEPHIPVWKLHANRDLLAKREQLYSVCVLPNGEHRIVPGGCMTYDEARALLAEIVRLQPIEDQHP